MATAANANAAAAADRLQAMAQRVDGFTPNCASTVCAVHCMVGLQSSVEGPGNSNKATGKWVGCDGGDLDMRRWNDAMPRTAMEVGRLFLQVVSS